MIRAIQPAALGGTLRVMPSKSASHRAVLAAALASEPCEVAPLQLSADVEATLRCARALGLLADCALEPLSGAQDLCARACAAAAFRPRLGCARPIAASRARRCASSCRWRWTGAGRCA